MSDERFADINSAPPIPSVSIENMVNVRAAVLERYATVLAILDEIEKMASGAQIGTPRFCVETYGGYRTPAHATDAPAAIRNEVDRYAWGHLMNESGMRTFMDATARKEWDEGLHNTQRPVPELTMDNVEATFGMMLANRRAIFERGVIRCFKNLSWCYKTNQPFRFGKRIIINHLFTVWGSSNKWLSLRHEATNELDDLVRVFHVLEGRPEPDHRTGTYSLISARFQAKEWDCTHEHFTLRWYKKGSGHLTFTRLDLVDRLNDIIARHYPGALPAPRD